MAYDEELAERVRDLIEPGLADEKEMFGGLAFLVGGHMGVAASGQGGLMVRVDPDQTEALLVEPGAEPFERHGRELKGSAAPGGSLHLRHASRDVHPGPALTRAGAKVLGRVTSPQRAWTYSRSARRMTSETFVCSRAAHKKVPLEFGTTHQEPASPRKTTMARVSRTMSSSDS